jgi:hypothetical protein
MGEHVVAFSINHSRSEYGVVEGTGFDDVLAAPLAIVIRKIRRGPRDNNADVDQAPHPCRFHRRNKVSNQLDMHALKGLRPFLTLDPRNIHDGIDSIEQLEVGATRVETGSPRKDTHGPSVRFERSYHMSAKKSGATHNGSSSHMVPSLRRRWHFMPSGFPLTG